MLVGAVLEDALRQLCRKHNVPEADNIEGMNVTAPKGRGLWRAGSTADYGLGGYSQQGGARSLRAVRRCAGPADAPRGRGLHLEVSGRRVTGTFEQSELAAGMQVRENPHASR